MKIILLNPQLQDSPLVRSLRQLGAAVLVASGVNEADLILKLHGRTISLFIGQDETGVEFNRMLKHSNRYSSVPVVIVVTKWGDQQCVEHQGSPEGANAYLRAPVADADLLRAIDEVMGTKLASGQAVSSPMPRDLSEFVEATRVAAMPSATDAPVPVAAEIAAPAAPVSPSFEGGISLPTMDATIAVGPILPSAPTAPAEPASPAMPILLTEAVPDSVGTSAPQGPEGDGITINIPIEPMGRDTSPLSSVAAEAPASSPPQDGISIVMESPFSGVMPEGAEMPPAVFGGVASPVSPEDEQLPDLSPPDATVAQAAPSPDASQSPLAPSAREPESESGSLDAEALQEMPYLAAGGAAALAAGPSPLTYTPPMDDAVIPGGAANAPDEDTLKRYLMLREQDVAALSSQLRQSKEQIARLEQQLRHERAMNTEFSHLVQEQEKRIEGFDREKEASASTAQGEVEELKFEMRKKLDKMKFLESQVREAELETERLKERVRIDIRKIRVREKELETRLEIMKRDSEALLGSREGKIVELKRKLDLLEFNMDLLQNQLEKERQASGSLREKLAKAAQVVRVAGGLLYPEAGAPPVENGENPPAGEKKNGDKTGVA